MIQTRKTGLIPLKFKILMVLCYLLPLLLNTPEGTREISWLIYIVPVLVITYKLGFRKGIFVAVFGTLIHFAWEAIELLSHGDTYNYHNFIIFVMVNSIVFAITILLGALVNQMKKKVELEETALKLKLSLDLIPEGFITLDQDLRITYLNKIALEMTPNAAEVLVGQKLTDVKEIEFSPLFLQNCVEAWESRQPNTFEFYSQLLQHWTEVSVYPSNSGLTLIVRDISERIEAKEALESSMEIFKKAFVVSPVPMALSRLDNAVFIDVNKSWEALTGYSKEEVVGRTSDALNLSLNLRQSLDLYNRIQAEGSIRNREIQLTTKTGELKTGLSYFELVRLGDEKYILGACHDISELKKIQAEMTRLDRLNLIGITAAGLGHEIRNPLTTVRGFLQLLGEDKEFAKAKERFDLMISEIDQANAIITEFLSLAKTKPTKLEQLNLNRLIERFYSLVVADALSKDKSIVLDLHKVPDIDVDAKEIRQLILNLVRNGLEAMSPGGVLTIKTFTDQDRIILAIQDQGPGISKEVIDKLGTPFLSTKDSGTGLGLAVCYGIAGRHNASIEFESGNNGTTFFVKFQNPPDPEKTA